MANAPVEVLLAPSTSSLATTTATHHRRGAGGTASDGTLSRTRNEALSSAHAHASPSTSMGHSPTALRIAVAVAALLSAAAVGLVAGLALARAMHDHPFLAGRGGGTHAVEPAATARVLRRFHAAEAGFAVARRAAAATGAGAAVMRGGSAPASGGSAGEEDNGVLPRDPTAAWPPAIDASQAVASQASATATSESATAAGSGGTTADGSATAAASGGAAAASGDATASGGGAAAARGDATAAASGGATAASGGATTAGGNAATATSSGTATAAANGTATAASSGTATAAASVTATAAASGTATAAAAAGAGTGATARASVSGTGSDAAKAATNDSSQAPNVPLPPWYAPNYVPKGAAAMRMWRTEDVQADIHRHQNPANCSAARFLRLQHVFSGLGSNFHVMSAFLAYAMNRGQVFVVECNFGAGWMSGPYCNDVPVKQCSYECFFAPLSSCAPNGVTPVGAEVETVSHSVMARAVIDEIPSDWKEGFLKAAPHPLPNPGDAKYWWRAQGVAYIMRLNERTAAELAARRRALAAGPALSVPLPLPRRTYAVYVRHGDKGKEMTIVDWDKVERSMLASARARAAVANANASGTAAAEGGASAAAATVQTGVLPLFLSTEDPEVVKGAQTSANASHGGMRVMTVPWERTNAGLGGLMNGAESLHALLNLWISMEGTHYVGQLGSNWCRLIDELRRVWVGDWVPPAHGGGAEEADGKASVTAAAAAAAGNVTAEAPVGGCCTPYIEVGCKEDVCPVDTVNW